MQKEYNNGEPERQGNEKNSQKYLDRVADMKASISRTESDIAAIKREIGKLPNSRSSGRLTHETDPAESARAGGLDYAAFDALATLVAVVEPDGRCLFANAELEAVVGLSRRMLTRGSVYDWFADPAALSEAIAAVSRNEFSARRFEGAVKRTPLSSGATLPVHVIVSQNDPDGGRVLVEMIENEQQTRQDREERALGQSQVTKELIRNLAHEIKNPLGGIRGAAQLLELEIDPAAGLSSESTRRSSSTRPTGCSSWWTACSRRIASRRNGGRRSTSTQVLERDPLARRSPSITLRGLKIERDYDTSIPEFRGDREQLIQAVLNIVHNATQALGEQIDADAAHRPAHAASRARRPSASSAIDWHWNCISRTTARAFPESIRDQIFYPLVSGRDGGSGLGLTLAQTFVQQHLGTIECDSVPGRTVFKILIPLR